VPPPLGSPESVVISELIERMAELNRPGLDVACEGRSIVDAQVEEPVDVGPPFLNLILGDPVVEETQT
jgi:hypothetical protein